MKTIFSLSFSLSLFLSLADIPPYIYIYIYICACVCVLKPQVKGRMQHTGNFWAEYSCFEYKIATIPKYKNLVWVLALKSVSPLPRTWVAWEWWIHAFFKGIASLLNVNSHAYDFNFCSRLNITAGEETRWQLHKNAACNPEQVLAATPHKTPTVRPPAPYHENYSS